MQREKEIVGPVLRFVVGRRPPLHDLDETSRIEYLARARRTPDFLGERQHRAAVAIGQAQKRLARFMVERQLLSFHTLGASEDLLECRLVERLEQEDGRPR